LLIQTPGALAAQAAAPTVVSTGQWFDVVLTVTNTGEADVTGVVPSIRVAPGTVLVAAQGTVNPAGPLTIAGGASQTFVWTYSASGAGAVVFSATASGSTCAGTAVKAWDAVAVTVQTRAALVARAVALPRYASIGQDVLVMVTVTNTGQADALGADASAFLFTGAGGVTYSDGPNPALPFDLAGGASQTFTWTYTGSVAGLVSWTTTISATDANSGNALRTGAVVSNTVLIQTPAALAGVVNVYGPSVCTGRTFLVTLTVTNAGQVSANGVTAAVYAQDGGGTASSVGPTPGLPVTLAAGASKTFTWTFTGVSAGLLTLTTTVTGTDANTGLSVTTGPLADGPLLIQTPGLLVGQSSAPAVVSTGQWFPVSLTVTNTGQADVTGVMPSIAVAPGAALVAVQGTVTPAGPLSIAGGASQTFVWTYSASGAGAVVFSATASGATCAGTAVKAWDAVAVTVQT